MRTHIVQKGDTLWKIAKQYGIDFEELKRLNAHLANPDYIVPGMEIILPDDYSSRKPTQTKKESEKVKAIEVPPKEKKAETPPKAKPIEKPEKVESAAEERPLPEIPPIPQVPQIEPIQQIQPKEKHEFHFDFAPHFSIQRQMPQPQFVPIPQPVIPQPIFIEIPQQVPQAVKEEKEKEKEKVDEKEYVPVPQTHVEYVPVPQPIYIPCMPHPVFPYHHHQKSDCGCKEAPAYHHPEPFLTSPHMLPPCLGFGGMQAGTDYQHMMPYAMNYSQGMPYPVQPAQDFQYDEQHGDELPQVEADVMGAQDDTDWLYDSESTNERTEGQQAMSPDAGAAVEQHQDYGGFEQAAMPSYDYSQMPQGYFQMEQGFYPSYGPLMPQPMYPPFGHGIEPAMQQYYPMGMNPCLPYFRPWSY